MNGSYILFIKLKKSLKIRVGKLGIIDFPKGYYCYVGSALGKNINLEKRLSRHFRKNKKRKWHIDYLLIHPFSFIEGVIIFPSKKRIECAISKSVEKKADFTFKKFGSSDCKCRGHLHYFKNKRSFINSIEKADFL